MVSKVVHLMAADKQREKRTCPKNQNLRIHRVEEVSETQTEDMAKPFNDLIAEFSLI
jgi:hypothetical protein